MATDPLYKGLLLSCVGYGCATGFILDRDDDQQVRLRHGVDGPGRTFDLEALNEHEVLSEVKAWIREVHDDVDAALEGRA